jgi:ATP-dependent Zn protease
MVEVYGMGGSEIGVSSFRAADDAAQRHAHLSPAQLEALDRRVSALLEEARQKAEILLRDNRTLVETLRDLLVEKKVIEARELHALQTQAKREGE